MKKYLIIIGLYLTSPVFGQSTAEKTLASVENVNDAAAFTTHHPQLKPEIRILTPQDTDTSLYNQLCRRKKGDVVTMEDHSYKIVEDTTQYTFEASYIYLDGSRLSRPAIDSIRTLIQKRYKAGATFETLVDEYTMDGNTQHGALRFIANMIVKEFETAVQEHANGDIFTVDVPNKEWYYVVKKTASDQAARMITVLSIFTPH